MIQQLKKDDIPVCMEVIHAAFAHDPLFTHVLQTEKEKHAFSAFMVNKAIALDECVMTFQETDKIKGVASFEKNTGKPLQSILSILRLPFIKVVLRLHRQTSPGTLKFINQYMKFTTSERPRKPHYYLVFIGIEPHSQGQGIGHALLDAIHEMTDQDKESVGIGLDTENVENVRYYEKFGYQLISQKTIGQVTIYAMFRDRLP